VTHGDFVPDFVDGPASTRERVSAPSIERRGPQGPAGITATKKLPLVVDLDGTLLLTDTLYESLVSACTKNPLALTEAFGAFATKGRAAMKARLTELCDLDVTLLPFRQEFVAWLQAEAASGRPLHLVSAGNARIVSDVARHLGFFSSAIGSDNQTNLKGAEKAALLCRKFPDGFAYAGDSRADVHVWRSAESAILAGSNGSVARKVDALGLPVEARFPNNQARLRSWTSALRIHQWAKNFLVFVPFLLSPKAGEVSGLIACALAFIAMGLASSATYLFNDLMDLTSDRRHRTKNTRALASGRLPILHAVLFAPLAVVAAFAIAASINGLTVLAIGAYLALTVAYSSALKRVPLLDTGVIGLLFTLRILVGCAATAIVASPWLLAFSILFFFGLAMAKRQTEIVNMTVADSQRVWGRGYQMSDAPLILVYGIGASIASLVIIMIYLTGDAPRGRIYTNQIWLWAVPLVLHFWLMRIWLFAQRGQLHDDPIVFALKDPISWIMGLGCALAIYLAI
jgi:4-hydroxybenzoate polyprenyltransferase